MEDPPCLHNSIGRVAAVLQGLGSDLLSLEEAILQALIAPEQSVNAIGPQAQEMDRIIQCIDGLSKFLAWLETHDGLPSPDDEAEFCRVFPLGDLARQLMPHIVADAARDRTGTEIF